MNIKSKRILEQIMPFIILGIIIAFAISLLIMFSYLLFWGAVIGAIIWAALAIKAYLFPSYTKKSEGHIIEHDKHD